MEIVLAGHGLELLPERAAWWPARETLLIADVHLGKDQVFRRHGLAVPADVLADELSRLDRLLDARPARRLIVLGDLIHAPPRAGESWPDAVAAWRNGHSRLDVGVVAGNHDRAIDGLLRQWGMAALGDEHLFEDLTLQHAADLANPAPGLSGHVHPVARLRAGPESLRLPAFARRGEHLILPAFGRFTGGFDLGRHAAWSSLAIAGDRIAAIG